MSPGADASTPHLTWTDWPIRADKSIFFELAGVHKHYHCPLSRTYYLGKPTQRYWTLRRLLWTACRLASRRECREL
nr:M24 family metallopeptidase [Rhizobium tibeticum]